MRSNSRDEEQLQEMFALVWAVHDGTVTRDQAARLEELVCTDAAAQAIYLDLVGFLAGLRWSLSACNESSLTALFPVQHRRTLVRKPVPARKSLRDRLLLNIRLIGIAASSLLACYFVALFGLGMWNHHQRVVQNRHSVQVVEEEPFATLTRGDDCRWGDVPGVAAGKRSTDKRLLVHAGLAELKFASGANVRIQGPAEFDVRSPSNGFLARGRLVATVPPSAVGFTIDTATATVTDLGTEFVLTVVESGESEVQVVQGLVSIRPESKTARTRPEPVLVKAGEARRVRIDGTIQVARSGALQGSIKGVTAKASTVYTDAISNSVFAPIHVVDNSGLLPGTFWGVGHHTLSLKDNGTMWLSASRERGKGDDHPWLIVDLGKVHNIESFHVWNFNEPAGSGRGIRDVDISYSSTNPEGTDILLGSYMFARGAEFAKEYGGEHFVTEFRARYIRLDIKSNWDGNNISYGLAEIQFDGKPVEP